MSDNYPQVKLETSEGTMVVELWPDVAPGHTENFLKLVGQGFYDGLSFHRILPEFVIQGGCPRGDGTGGPGWNIKAEFNDRKHEKGVLSMARSGDPDSAGSQFFVCLGRERCQHLDGQYTAFGKVIEGLDIVDKIGATPLTDARAGSPVKAPTMVKVSVVGE
ncbi:MAG TPA: peptidylprolyl isomerase [Phycisphaerales bacterium]|nr:peptidylprolyl isomerase [Phycisphaerales bacterium]HCD33612.1 peptidylprolyl isomerase [Phycisphaerales bacterium]|tara:strand:- start:220 stop:705 length:486 start_codon:yes stop_codon:yes gene_type:complete